MKDAATAGTSETVFWRRANWSPGVYWLLAFNAALVAFAERWGGSDVPQVIARMGAVTSGLVASGEGWRLFASGYLHFGFEHLANNLMAIWFFGRILEGAVGTARFLVLYTAAVLCGAIAHCAISSDGLLAGASGGAFGILAGSLVLLWRSPELLPPFSRAGYAGLMVVYIGFSLVLSQFSPVSLIAHAGGAAGGAYVVWIGLATWGLAPLATGEPEKTLSQWVVHGLAAGAIFATTGSIAYGCGLYRPWEITAVPPSEFAVIPGTPIALAVPRTLLLRTASREVDGVTEVSFGDFLFDPVAVRASSGVSPASAASQDLRETLAGFEEEMLASVDPAEEDLSEPALVEVSGHLWLFLDSRRGATRLERWSTILGEQRIDLMIAVSRAAPAVWQQAAEQVVPSVRTWKFPGG
jgi:membrane associated rhomboid family serine protease